jgi:hypothetical protein
MLEGVPKGGEGEEGVAEGRGELIVIRHAQSQFNQGFLDYRREHQLGDQSWYDCVHIPHFN